MTSIVRTAYHYKRPMGKRKSRFGTAEDITVEESNRRADAADALFQEFKRQIAEKLKERQP